MGKCVHVCMCKWVGSHVDTQMIELATRDNNVSGKCLPLKGVESAERQTGSQGRLY